MTAGWRAFGLLPAAPFVAWYFALAILAALPGAVATLLHEIAGTPRWLAVILIPIALLLARSADREVVS